MHRKTHGLRAAIALLGCVLMAAGCSGSEHQVRGHAATPAGTTPPSSQSDSRARTPTPRAATAPPPRHSASAVTTHSTTLPAAADGTDVQACADGNCEVLLTHAASLTMDCGCGIATMTMTVTPGGVNFTGVADDGTQVGAEGQLPDQGGASKFNEMSMAVVGFNGREAVIKLST